MKACSVVTLAFASVILTTVASKPGAAIEKQAAAPVTLLAGPTGTLTFIQPVTPAVPQPEAATFGRVAVTRTLTRPPILVATRTP
jgi:hypothetical protein